MANRNRLRTAQALTIALAGLTFAAPSHAYLDPGTGSIILQSILASVAVAIGVLRLYWHRFKSFIASLTGNSGETKSPGGQDLAQDTDSHHES